LKISSAERVDVVGGGAGGGAAGAATGVGILTTIFTAAEVAVPPGPVAVAVKLVVAVGLTCRVPLVPWTAPIPGWSVTDVAFIVVYVSVADCPAVMVPVFEVSVIVGAGAAGGGAATGGGGGGGAATFFEHPANASANARTSRGRSEKRFHEN